LRPQLKRDPLGRNDMPAFADRLRAINLGQLATLWAAAVLFAALLAFYWARTESANASDRARFGEQLNEYRTQLAQSSAELRAYQDSAAELSALTSQLRHGRAASAKHLEANEGIVRHYLDVAKTVRIEVDLYRRLVQLQETSAAASLHRGQQTRISLGAASLTAALLVLAGTLACTWYWFGARGSKRTDVAA